MPAPAPPEPVLKNFRSRLGLTQEWLAERLASLAWDRRGEMELGFRRPAPRCECASARLGDVERRELLRLLGAAGALLSPGIGELAAAQPGEAAWDGDPVHSVRSITRHYRRLWATTPTQDLTGPVLGHLRLAGTLLETSRSEADRVRLAAAASETAVLAAWLARDSWDHTAALRHHQAAIAYAERAGNDLLRAYTLALTSYWAAVRSGNGDEAVRRIERAQGLLPPDAPPACGVDLWGLEAVARASVHDPSAALHALGHAEELLQRSEEQDEAPWPLVFPCSYGYTRQRITVAIECKLPRMALPLLEEVIKALGGAPNKRHAYALCDLASVKILSGEIEEACHLTGEAFATAVRLDVKESMQKVKEIRDRLERWKTTRAVTELDERLQSSGCC